MSNPAPARSECRSRDSGSAPRPVRSSAKPGRRAMSRLRRWAQCLFAAHLGDGTPKSTISGENKRFFYSATISSSDKVLHLKLVNASNTAQPLSSHLTGQSGSHTAR
jgi:hypothetical protein